VSHAEPGKICLTITSDRGQLDGVASIIHFEQRISTCEAPSNETRNVSGRNGRRVPERRTSKTAPAPAALRDRPERRPEHRQVPQLGRLIQVIPDEELSIIRDDRERQGARNEGTLVVLGDPPQVVPTVDLDLATVLCANGHGDPVCSALGRPSKNPAASRIGILLRARQHVRGAVSEETVDEQR
jgi:hypothetical protein